MSEDKKHIFMEEEADKVRKHLDINLGRIDKMLEINLKVFNNEFTNF